MLRKTRGLMNLVTFIAVTAFLNGELAAQRAAGAGQARARHGATGGNVQRNVNTTTVNRNVNVNVNGNRGYGAHPVARGAVAGATAAVVMGHYYSTLPTGCATVHRGGIVYHHCGSHWYKTAGNQYVVVAAP